MPKSQHLFYPRTASNKANWEYLTSSKSDFTITDCVCDCLNDVEFKARYPYDCEASMYFWEAINPEEATTMNRKILNIAPAVVKRLQTMLDNNEIDLDQAAFKVCKMMRNTLSVKLNVCKYWQRRIDRYKRVRKVLPSQSVTRRVDKPLLMNRLDEFIGEHKMFPRFASFNKEVIFPRQQHAPFFVDNPIQVQ